MGLSEHDPQRLLTEQYRDERNLSARMRLHERFSTNPQPWHRWVFDQLAIEPGSAVLEIGCGPGTLWGKNADRLPADGSFLLTDLSPGMASAARLQLHAFRYGAVDAQRLPFADATFDLVVANHMLYHVPDRQRAVAQDAARLRDGGRLCAATNALGHLRELDELAQRYVPQVSLAESAQRFSLEGGGALLAPHFSDLRTLRYDDSLVITDANPVVEYVLSSGAAVAADTIEALRQEVASIIARKGAFRVRKETGLFVASV